MIIPGRNLINVGCREEFHQKSDLRVCQKTHRELNMNVMSKERLSCTHQILLYIRELIHMNSPVNVMDLIMLSTRNHTFENIRELTRMKP